MISVRDHHGNLYPVSSAKVTTNQDLYEALSTEYHLGPLKLYFQGRYLSPEAISLCPEICDGTHIVGIFYINPQSSASSSAESSVSVDRFSHFHFARHNDLKIPDTTDCFSNVLSDPSHPNPEFSDVLESDLNQGNDLLFQYHLNRNRSEGGEIWFVSSSSESQSEGRNEEEEEERGEDGLDDEEREIVQSLIFAYGHSWRTTVRAFYANGRDHQRTSDYFEREFRGQTNQIEET
jgi:hypothetical protein